MMENIKPPFSGITSDIHGRALCYKQDWVNGLRSRIGILAPIAYLFFASVLPVIAFGEQLSTATGRYQATFCHFKDCAFIGCIRSFVADYGVPLIVVVWTVLSFTIPSKVPNGVPRRLFGPFAWEFASLYHWTVIQALFHFSYLDCDPGEALFHFSYLLDYLLELVASGSGKHLPRLHVFDMAKVPLVYIFAAFVPAVMIAGLYFFDHSVVAQLAQQKEFNLKNPSAYHYGILLLGFMTLLSGLIGLPPSNGVLPQCPMHTRSLAILKRQLIRNKMVQSAKESIKQQASNSEIYGKMQAVFIEMDSPPATTTVVKELENLKQAILKNENAEAYANVSFDPEKHIDAHLPVRVNEQRVSNLLQSLLMAASSKTRFLMFMTGFDILIPMSTLEEHSFQFFNVEPSLDVDSLLPDDYTKRDEVRELEKT
ncbi:Bicarbonate transporter-like, transmembrane domain [Dillenia turbinata]|uniref:Bicarbonate transporter-like, transmembrane domain n=1 Tax=Dillenia turbinata TaxID=194707 RepID=A0AAN8UI34_9MAGN